MWQLYQENVMREKLAALTAVTLANLKKPSTDSTLQRMRSICAPTRIGDLIGMDYNTEILISCQC